MVQRTSLLTIGAALASVVPLAGQFAPGGREIYAINFAAMAPGAVPAGLRLVQKDGVSMLKASSVSEFEVSLPEKLPDQFTLQFEIIPKECCNPEDLFFAGTSSKVRSENSAEFSWHRNSLTVTGGGSPSPFTSDMPSDLRETLPGALTSIDVSFDGETVKLYTNGRRVFTLTERRFARGRVLRVRLGGQNDGEQAVYLAKLRVATGPPVLVQEPVPPPPAPVSAVLMPPPPPPAATGMVTPASAPSPPAPGTGLSTGALVAGSAGVPLGTNSAAAARAGAFAPPAPRTLELGGFAAVGISHTAPGRAMTLGGFTGVGVSFTGVGISRSAPPRTIALTGFTGAGTVTVVAPPTKAIGGLPATVTTTYAPPRTITLTGFSGSGSGSSSASGSVKGTSAPAKNIVTTGFTAQGPTKTVPPRTIKLGGFTATSP